MTDAQSLYNEDELHPPKWLNEKFLLRVLRKNEKVNEIELLDTKISPGTGKSDHYASIMFRIKLTYVITATNGTRTTKTQSMILKTVPEVEGVKKELIDELKVFETEIRMYTETLPKIEGILRKAGDNTVLCAKLIYHELEPQQCLIFEDLVEKGYTTIANRSCTMDEVKVALQKLAKMHAVSYMLAQEGDTDVTAYREGSFNSKKVEEMDAIQNAIVLFKEILNSYDDLRQYLPYVEKVEGNILENIVGYFNAYANGERGGIQVLNHGDFHMKNMMIKNVNGNLEELMLLDYQLSIFGTAAIDLHYSYVLLMSPAMRLNHRDELYYFYYDTLTKTLHLLDFKGHVPTLSEFWAELWKYRQWELYLICGFLIISHIFCDPAGDLQRFVEDSSYRREIFTRPGVVEEIRNLFPRLIHKGYFED